jgi:transposase
MDRAVLQELLSEGLSLAEIGRRFDRHEATVAYWLQRHGLEAAGLRQHAAKGALTRSQLEPLIEAGMSIAQIAGAVGRSKATVRHWLGKHELKTVRAAGAKPRYVVRLAREAGLREATLSCPRHGETDHVRDGRGYLRCRRCRAEAVVRRRRRVKKMLVEEAGGGCRLCGYDRCAAALVFHHLDPTAKEFGVAYAGMARSIERLRAEVCKCILLCSNCHAEVESGVSSLSRIAQLSDLG